MSPNINGQRVLSQSERLRERKNENHVSGSFKFDPDDLATGFLTAKHGIEITYTSISEKYRFGELVGSGLFGVISPAFDRALEVENQASGAKQPSCTVKTISKACVTSESDFDHIMSEVILLNKLSHENLLKMDSFWDNHDSFYLVLEPVVGQDLFNFIVENEVLYESTARNIFKQILAACAYMHECGIVHRDLKPDNFLVNSEGVIKVCDFSIATDIGPDNSIFSPFCVSGTPGYAAPEILSGELYSFSADLFSAGVMLFILLGGFPPFDISPETKIYPPHEFTEPFFEHVSDHALNLIDVLLSKDPSARGGSAKDLLDNDPWFRLDLSDVALTAGLEKMKEFSAKRKFRVAAKSVSSAIKIARAASKMSISTNTFQGPRKPSMAFNPAQMKELEGMQAKNTDYVRLRSFSAEGIKEAVESVTEEN
jgi:serine/threonine protein kinase